VGVAKAGMVRNRDKAQSSILFGEPDGQAGWGIYVVRAVGHGNGANGGLEQLAGRGGRISHSVRSV